MLIPHFASQIVFYFYEAPLYSIFQNVYENNHIVWAIILDHTTATNIYRSLMYVISSLFSIVYWQHMATVQTTNTEFVYIYIFIIMVHHNAFTVPRYMI